MAGVDRYGNPYNGRKRGRKPIDRMGKKCLPSKLAWQKDYNAREKENLKARQKELDRLDPSRVTRRYQRDKERKYLRLKLKGR